MIFPDLLDGESVFLDANIPVRVLLDGGDVPAAFKGVRS
jgi:hypothetical protein